MRANPTREIASEDNKAAKQRESAEITLATVQKWIAEEAPRWPVLPEEHLVAVSCACNHERHQQHRRAAVKSEYGERWKNHLAAIQRARTGIDLVLSELDAIETEIKRINEEWRTASASLESEFVETGQEHLQICAHARQVLTLLKEIFRATRKQGRQENKWTEFAGRLSDHLRLVLELAATPASLKEDAPLARLVVRAVEAVYGEIVTPSAVANALQRREKRRKQALATN